MFDFVPIEYYTPIYYYILFVIILVTFVHTQSRPLISKSTFQVNKIIGFVTLTFVLLYLGLRPISGVFTDMTTYNNIFVRYLNGADITSNKDLFFHIFTRFLSKIVAANTYFLICACLYVIPMYIVCKKWFKSYWFYGFLFLIGAFSFWAYGTNGIRNGIASSLFLLAVSREKRIWQILWIILAVNFHKTMLLPALGFLFANIYNQPKKLIIFWALCIPLSLIGGGVFESFFGTIGFDDDRMSYLTAEITEGKFTHTGFRWDFLLYSSTGVLSGWYYIVKKKFNDKIYFWLFNTYVFANAFWILVIRANYSNRFAYLSWFMIGLIIIYPLLRKQIIPKQHKRIGIILVAYFSFTLLMNIILKN